MCLLEHPKIVNTMKYGYPYLKDPQPHYCEECGKCLDNEDEYEDANHEFLCESCLCMIHKKWW